MSDSELLKEGHDNSAIIFWAPAGWEGTQRGPASTWLPPQTLSFLMSSRSQTQVMSCHQEIELCLITHLHMIISLISSSC